MNEIVNQEDELFKYNSTPFQNKSKEIIEEISNTFKELDFTDLYIEYRKNGKYDKQFVEDVMYDKILTLDEYKRHDLNEMWAMLSSKNCWYIDYEIGQIVHNQLMKTWYPEDYLISN